MAKQCQLYEAQAHSYSDFRVNKIVALRDCEHVFYDLDGQRVTGVVDSSSAWRLFTDEALRLYRVAEHLEDGYSAGVALALDCQRGHHRSIDVPVLNRLLE